jgi:hypothetical protein
MVMKKEETLQDYKKFQKQLTRDEFSKRFNYPFLVFNKERRTEEADDHSFITKRVQPDQLENMMKKALMKTVSSKVFKVIKKGTNSFQGNINIGRTSNCDVAINNPTISKFHAFLARDIKSGSYYIIDADSTNGTYVNDMKLNPNEKKVLYDGDTVSFGRQITISFYTPQGCYDLLEQIPD